MKLGDLLVPVFCGISTVISTVGIIFSGLTWKHRNFSKSSIKGKVNNSDLFMNSTVCKNVLENRTLVSREILHELGKKIDDNTDEIQRNKRALNFGHNHLEENHIHDVKPAIALPYWSIVFSSSTQLV